MDVWVEFKNASKWQAEALFRNFFPSTDEDEGDITLDAGELDSVEISMPSSPIPPSPLTPPTLSSGTSTLWSLSSSSSSTSLSSPSSTSNKPPLPPLRPTSDDFGAKNKAYLPPPVEEHIAAAQHSAKPLDSATLGVLAKQFADSIPDEEFSVAALQGCEFVTFIALDSVLIALSGN
jgi:mitochondrial chaperone BCS1